MLVILTFFFTIFGTFMTRSGVVRSVTPSARRPDRARVHRLHAVLPDRRSASSSTGCRKLRSNGAFGSFASREIAFLLNNWILLAVRRVRPVRDDAPDHHRAPVR
ncbi:MAG: hypothetical protein IPH80_28540 [Myxococcales bacterium]|nr:hypothetical protein [Myxococcales bacterium]